MKRIVLVAVLLLLFVACEKNQEPAPPSPPASTQQSSPGPETQRSSEAPPPADEKAHPATEKYTVAKGDTLFGIAQKHGLDYRDLAKWNNIEDPDQIRVGQDLRLTAPGSRSLR
jgi:lipoprotein NlpD